VTEPALEAPAETTLPTVLPALPLKETVVFPDSMSPLAIGQERSIRLIDDVVAGERMLVLLTVKNPQLEQPGWDDVCHVGTAALVHKLVRVPDGTLRILVQGLERVRLQEPAQDEPYLVGAFESVPDVHRESKEVDALTRNVQGLFTRVIALVPYLP
jgi:ATP-dependent Lon protease